MINYKDSLDNYMPIYYHFLDGYINKDVGYNKNKIYDFILKNNILPNNKITLLNYYINDNKLRLEFIFNNLLINNFIINFSDKIESNRLFNEIETMFNYCICQIGIDKHATSLLFYINNKKMYACLFNSGEGINYHKLINTINTKKHYSPYKGVMICNDIENEIELIKGLKYIVSLLIIAKLYESIQNNSLMSNIKTIIKQNNENTTSYEYYNIEPICQLINYLKSISDIKLNKIGFDFMINNKMIDELYSIPNIDIYLNGDPNIDIYLNDDTLYLNKAYDHLNKRSSKYISKSTNIRNQKENYYKIICNIFSLSDSELELSSKINFNNDIIFNMMNPNIRNKLILHYNNDYYIYDQESGSCTWFSMYWPIIFYNIFNFDEDNYSKTIIDIYNIMNQIVNRVFNEDSLNLCFIEDEDNFINMKLLCEKFIVIKIIDPKLLFEQNNFIYKHKYEIKYEKNTQEYNINSKRTDNINEHKFFNNDELLKYLHELYNIDISSSLYDHSQSKKNIKIKLQVESFNDTIILIKQLFNYQKEKEINLFSKEKPNIDFKNCLKIVKEEFTDIDQKLIDELFLNLSYYRVINNIPYNLENYIKQFIDTYTDIDEPMYIKNYIYWIPLIFDNEPEYHSLLTFIHRFSLFILILTTVYYIIHYTFTILRNSGKIDFSPQEKNRYTNLILNMYILPLLNNKQSFNIQDIKIIDCKIIDINYDLKYISHLININNILIKRDFVKITVFKNQNKLIQCDSFLENYSRSICDYINLKEFLYENPNYIHQDFNDNELIIDTNQFVKINLKEIFKNENIRNKLITYYSIKYYEKSKISEIFWIISNLQLLICGKIGYLENVDIPDIFIYYAFVYEYSPISFK